MIWIEVTSLVVQNLKTYFGISLLQLSISLVDHGQNCLYGYLEVDQIPAP